MGTTERESFRCALISDFNIANLGGYLQGDSEAPRVEVVSAPYGDVMPPLLREDHEVWADRPDCALVWTRPQSVLPTFREILAQQPAPVERALEEVDEFAALVAGLASRVSSVFVPTWVVPDNPRGLGLLDLRDERGIGHALLRINARLLESLRAANGVHLLDAQRWVAAAGPEAFNPKLWYLTKVAFGNEVQREAVQDLKAALRALTGRSRKLLILDLDDTLWGGIVGDVGWENLRLGGHDAVGEAFVEFQQTLKALARRGIILGVVSKNEESTAVQAIEQHPEMVLGLDDIAGWRINWSDKAANIVDLVEELNLGLDSAVFIDDNPVERSRVREALPDVLVPDWPAHPTLYKSALLELRCFDTAVLSDEDGARSEQYVAERQRRGLRQSIRSVDDWLASLEQRVVVEALDATNGPRAAQLLNKTNQMNLATRRMTQSELTDWIEGGDRHLWTFRVADKFSDSGLTGILSLEVDGDSARIVDFLLSCRVMGRRIEESMLHVALDFARSRALREVSATFVPTAKNNPCLEFWTQRSGFSHDAAAKRFRWDVADPYRLPECVTLERLSS
jgi:FkbH-like protein